MKCPRCGAHIKPDFYCLSCGYVPTDLDTGAIDNYQDKVTAEPIHIKVKHD